MAVAQKKELYGAEMSASSGCEFESLDFLSCWRACVKFDWMRHWSFIHVGIAKSTKY